MHLEGGKRPRQPVVAATGCLPTGSRLMVTEKTSGHKFLIDTGSDLCCFPRRLLTGRRHQVTAHELSAANGSVIKTYGLVTLALNLGLRRSFSWSFIIADVSMPIIGNDFLAYYHLLPDCKLKRLIDGETSLFVSCNAHSVAQPSVKAVSDSLPYADLLAKFPDITRPPGKPREITHNTVHFIKTLPGPPVSCRPRRLVGDRLTTAQQEYRAMLEDGTARPSDSPWSSALHIVRKKSGSGWRPCGDYRALNARTVADCYPVKHIQDFAHNIADCKIFGLIDLVKAYQQIPVHPEDICKTAVATPFGLFEFPFMPFGLRNAAQTFQRFMDEVTRGLDFCYCYIDDILIFSRTPEEHKVHLEILLQRLSNYGVVLNPAKCIFEAAELDFLGYRISAAGISPPTHRVDALRAYPLPPTVKDLRRFLGMINFYRRFLPQAAELQAPLHDLLSGPKVKGSTPVPWTPALETAFKACKDHLAKATLLTYPKTGVPLALFTDVSLKSAGAVLQQFVDNAWQPLAFFSKKLSQRHSDWPPFHRELLAIYESVFHFRHALEGQHFTIYTDHKPLIFLFTQKRDKLPPIQRNQLTYVSQFTTDVRHVSGVDNVVADSLSRINLVTLKSVDHKALAEAQEQDEELKTLPPDSPLVLEHYTVPGTHIQLKCDRSAGRPRPFVPTALRRQIFDQLHGLSHPGVRTTIKMVTDRFVWPSVNKDVRLWARTCLQCQRSKVSRHVTAPLGNFTPPSSRFSHVHIDLIGPLPVSKGFKYCLTCVDRWTRWPEVCPIQDVTADTVAAAFMTCWISRFGVPERITTDRGAQFRSFLFHNLAERFGIEMRHTTSYHPAANGQCERLHRQLKAAIMAHDDIHWIDALPLVLLGIRNAFKEDIQATTAELVFGEPLRLPGELVAAKEETTIEKSEFAAKLRQHFSKLRPIPASRHANPSSFVYRDLSHATHVLLRVDKVRRSLEAPYTGPYRIISRSADNKSIVLDVKGKPNTVSIDRVKPAYLLAQDDTSDEQLLPPDGVLVRQSAKPEDRSPPASRTQPTPTSRTQPTLTSRTQPTPTSRTQPTPQPRESTAPPTAAAAAPPTTRAGRRVRFPDRFIPG